MSAPYDQIVAQLNACQTGAELNRLVAQVRPQLDALLASITAAESVLSAGQELLTLSAGNLSEVVTFVGKLKTEVLGPMLAAYAKTVSAQASAVTGIASVTAAISAAASRIGVPVPP